MHICEEAVRLGKRTEFESGADKLTNMYMYDAIVSLPLSNNNNNGRKSGGTDGTSVRKQKQKLQKIYNK